MMQSALLITTSVLGAGICSALEGTPDWFIRCVSPPQAPEAIADLAQWNAPTVTIFDMTCLNVLDLFQQLGQARVKLFGKIAVATLSGLDEEELFHLAMWGVAAHISGDAEPGELVGILQRVTLGEYLLTGDCLRKARVPAPRPRRAPVIEEPLVLTRDASPAAAEATPLPSRLTEREATVLCCIAQGMTNKEVAQRLGLAEHTIKNGSCPLLVKR